MNCATCHTVVSKGVFTEEENWFQFALPLDSLHPFWSGKHEIRLLLGCLMQSRMRSWYHSKSWPKVKLDNKVNWAVPDLMYIYHDITNNALPCEIKEKDQPPNVSVFARRRRSGHRAVWGHFMCDFQTHLKRTRRVSLNAGDRYWKRFPKNQS